jgi:hypothetical protein
MYYYKLFKVAYDKTTYNCFMEIASFAGAATHVDYVFGGAPRLMRATLLDLVH